MSSVIPDPATTDWVPLGGVGIQGGLIPISEIVLGADGPIDFTNIPQTYAHLRLMAQLRSAATGGRNATMRLNGDTGANYVVQRLYGAGATAGAAAVASAAQAILPFVVASDGAASRGSVLGIDFLNYAGTTFQKAWIASGGDGAGAMEPEAGLWTSTAAINRIQLASHATGAGFTDVTWKAGSRATLYGLAAPGVTYLPQATRVVSGLITGAGAIAGGTGFTAARTGIGQYTITFATPFTAPPAVTLTVRDGAVLIARVTSALNANSFSVVVWNMSSAATDGGFDFIAIGT